MVASVLPPVAPVPAVMPAPIIIFLVLAWCLVLVAVLVCVLVLVVIRAFSPILVVAAFPVEVVSVRVLATIPIVDCVVIGGS